MTDADETREDGWYWIKVKHDSAWIPMRFSVLSVKGVRKMGVWNNPGYSLDKRLKGRFYQVYPFKIKQPL